MLWPIEAGLARFHRPLRGSLFQHFPRIAFSHSARTSSGARTRRSLPELLPLRGLGFWVSHASTQARSHFGSIYGPGPKGLPAVPWLQSVWQVDFFGKLQRRAHSGSKRRQNQCCRRNPQPIIQYRRRETKTSRLNVAGFGGGQGPCGQCRRAGCPVFGGWGRWRGGRRRRSRRFGSDGGGHGRW